MRLSRVVIPAATLVTFAACSDVGPTAPQRTLTAAASNDRVVNSAQQQPVAGCTVTQFGGSYTVTISWSGISVSSIDFWQNGGTQPLSQTVLAHPKHNGSWWGTFGSAPDYAEVNGRRASIKANCILSSGT